MKSFINTKIYWKVRKCILSLIFKCKSSLYKQIDKVDTIKEYNSLRITISKVTIKESIRGILGALLAFVIDDIILKNYCLTEDVIKVFVNVITCSIGVAGVILGLYCANISSMYMTRYANAPDNIALAFQRDRINRRSISSNISYIIFGIAVIIEIMLGCSIGWTTVAMLVFRLFFLLIAYSITGNRAYQLSDVYHVTDDSYRVLFRIIKKRLRQSVFSSDINFQNHFLKETEKKLSVLKAVQKYTASNKHDDNSAMVSFMCRNLLLIEEYWKYKESISRTSLWFRNEDKYQQWHLISSHEASVALSTGTALQPKREHNYWWFEDELIDINHSCLKVLLNVKDYASIYEYLYIANEVGKTALYCKEAKYYAHQINWLKKTVVEEVVREAEDKNEKTNLICGILEVVSLMYLGMILNSRKYYEEFNIQNHMDSVVKTLDEEQPVALSPSLQGSSNTDLYEKIATEIRVQGFRITPTWLIKQYIAKEEYDYLNSLIDILCDAINQIFSLGEDYVKKGKFVEACIILSRFYEFESKLDDLLVVISEKEKEISSFHIDKNLIWVEFRISELEKVYETWKAKIPDLLLQCSGQFALDKWKNNRGTLDEYPDFVGSSFNHICADAVEAIANNNIKQFAHDFDSLSKLMLLYQEYIRVDMLRKKDEYNDRYVYYLVTSPIVEWAEIGGLAILWGEFTKCKEWKDKVDHGNDLIIKKNGKITDFAERLIDFIRARDSYMMGSSARNFVEAEWKIKIENAIRNSDLYEIEYGVYGKQIKTGSKLLKAFCRDFPDFGFHSDPAEVLWVLCLNPLLPESKKYQTRFSWEDKLK